MAHEQEGVAAVERLEDLLGEEGGVLAIRSDDALEDQREARARIQLRWGEAPVFLTALQRPRELDVDTLRPVGKLGAKGAPSLACGGRERWWDLILRRLAQTALEALRGCREAPKRSVKQPGGVEVSQKELTIIVSIATQQQERLLRTWRGRRRWRIARRGAPLLK